MKLAMLLALAWSLAGSVAILAAEDDGTVFFEKEVRPLLVKHCYECHSGPKSGGGLSLETRAGWTKGGETGPAIVPGQPAESLLIKAVSGSDPGIAMPPDEKGRAKLTKEEVATLVEWVRRGAPDPRVAEARLGGMPRSQASDWWAFRPIAPAPIPPISASGDGLQSDIDRFLEARLKAEGLTNVGPADRRTLIRRATYDLTGLPPTVEQVEEFLNDPAEETAAFAKVVERLLASPEYGVQWGRHWLDVVRYADTAGENTDRPLPHAWRYRNWVFDAFRRDIPFNEFIRMQLAGDILRKDASDELRNEGIVATGYLAIARRFGHDIDKDFHLTVEDAIDNLGKNFLGMTTGCARCHDHKYDPITAEDYYALYGIFDSTRFAFPGCEPKGQPRDLVPLMSPTDVETKMAPWRQGVARRDAEVKRRAESASPARLKTLVGESLHTLATSPVGEGGSVAIAGTDGQPLRVAVRKGEVLQLSVAPNGNHGADSTLVEWVIDSVVPAADGTPSRWSVADIIPSLTAGNPAVAKDGSAWCFLHLPDGPGFLNERKDAINGHAGLRAWSAGDTPSVFVNASEQPVSVWTTLPARSFFVHPGPDRPVAVAWVAPTDGEFAITGRVADAHPAGLDGITFKLEHLASPEFGAALVEAGRLLTSPLPDPGPEPTIPMAYAVVEGAPHDAPLQERGDPEKRLAAVPRRWLDIFGGTPVPPGGGSGRKELGDWISTHPLTTRVMANRIWQWHFGAGLVRTPNDFGSRGERPTHPELLEWLAARFIASGYSIKAMHRTVMNSAAYRRSSALPDWPIERDPDNRLLARFTRRRLTAEEIRDSLLTCSGALDRSPAEAHPFPAEKTWTFTQHNPFNAVYETNRRSAYLMVQRQRRHPFLALFDGADPSASTPVRQTTTVPTQSLYFLNDPFFHAQAERLATRVLQEADESTRLALAWRTLFQRLPSTAESDQATRFLASYPGTQTEQWSAYLRVLLASNPFLYVD